MLGSLSIGAVEGFDVEGLSVKTALRGRWIGAEIASGKEPCHRNRGSFTCESVLALERISIAFSLQPLWGRGAASLE